MLKVDDIVTLGNSRLREISRSLTNKFWKDCFNYTADMLDNVHFLPVNLFGLQPICGNNIFKIDNKPIEPSMVGY